MPLPGNVSTLVVIGTFLTPEGNPSTGTITFTPSRWLTNSGANVALPNSGVTKTLGTAGNFQVTLPVTDDGDLQPANWYYTVSEVVDGVSQSYALLLPGTAGSGGTVYLADLAPAAELGPEYASLRGPAGEAATVTVGTVTAGTAGGTPTVTNSGSSSAAVLNFSLIPGNTGPTGATGATGSTGPQGSAATVAVGTVTTGTAGSSASVTNSGTSGAAVLDFVIPRGNTGATGATGSAATVTVGSVTTVAFGGTAAVTNSGTSGSAVLDFVLVTGPQGDLAGLSANAPIRYASNTFSLNVGSGLETAGTTLAVTYGTAASALGSSAAGSVDRAARQDHVHAMPTAAQVGALGTAALSSTSPTALGTASAGTATAVAREDHVHPTTGVVLNALVDAKGDLVTATADNTPARLAVGSNGQVLVAASGEATGLIWQGAAEVIGIAVSDEETAITTGTAKVTFRMPFAMTLTAVRASLTTASTSGLPTFDINEGGTTILSTKLSIDANEKTSTTAATAAVISDSALADDAEITIDIDVAGTGAKGAKVYLIGRRA